ncbi:hypothetical protein [Haloarchaeobius sp. HME9146]|uniref:hypothetical protein n=1 Tax=Haloarchaeobius sp. HME9146 TaxID=2978732 RepID=UPI0021BF7E0E|nr:hypothetical protein [Haloarchaeobius sp. HME9146]MCT9097949.1 hypothetical protein [Haloarchaeobius sp. HME9146]
MASDPRSQPGSGDRHPKTSVTGVSAPGEQPDGAAVPELAEGTPLGNRFWLLLAGILLVTMPAFTLLVLFAILSVTRSALLDELTLLEIAEVYLVEFVMFAVFSYLLYRLLMYSVERQRSSSGTISDDDEGESE